MHIAVGFALFGFFASSVSAAYVQHQTCGNEAADSLSLPVDSLRLRLSSEAQDTQQLTWRLRLMVRNEEECSSLVRNATASMAIETAFYAEHKKVEPVLTCDALPRVTLGNTHGLEIVLQDNVQRFYPLATFHAEIRLGFAYNDTLFCAQANVTPSLRDTTSLLLRWIPMSIFLVVLIVGILRSYFDKPIRLPDDLDEDGEDSPGRPVLPHVGDCLHYLQFIFLTGALSLGYPGFYQPVVSHLNWFSLLLTGPITIGPVYPRVADGIYEVNGTYGGTYGLELMHQIIGAPHTMITWLNMAVSIVIIAAIVGLLTAVQVLLSRSRDEDLETVSQGPATPFMRFRLNHVLRVILSYFTLPLIALSFYQFDNAAWQPAYHTSLAALLLVCVMAAFAWLMYQVPMRSLGMLVFDSKRYQRMSTLLAKDRYNALFVMILFVLSFTRGAAIGGLQISPASQLAILGASEIILLICISGFQAYSARSVGTISAVLRLLTVGLMMAFHPGLGASLGAKSLVGYAILAIHTIMLLCGFLAPAIYNACLLSIGNRAAPKPDVYRLRALRRRGATSSTDVLRLSNAPNSPRLSSNHGSSPHLSRSSHGFSPDLRQEEYLHRPNHFFRAPRPISEIGIRSDGFRSQKLRSSTSTNTVSSTSSSGRSDSRVESPKEKPTIRLGPIAEPHYQEAPTSRTSESSSAGSAASANTRMMSNLSGEVSQERPLGPRWHDYSFREADLYYMAGQEGQVPADEELMKGEPANQEKKWRKIRKVSSGLWSRVVSVGSAPAPEERGFSVVRPNRPPPGAIIPGQTSQIPSPGLHMPSQTLNAPCQTSEQKQ
ncbi:hypothetical protein NLU13_6017 [Sarocladium strictum]|uniref:TRP C-terminal domain-containing protein n=1 Tax=Sarocladium strictum TaxID=5046 RepID=A0AA39L6V9_SARSR|nr:hypothetical protein NLU13_6017 [Sarocladium strictum]